MWAVCNCLRSHKNQAETMGFRAHDGAKKMRASWAPIDVPAGLDFLAPHRALSVAVYGVI